MRPLQADVHQHLYTPGPKRILTLDGGGIRGVISLQILKKIESLLQQRHGAQMRLCDYFDLIAGTSTGAIIAAGLAIGMRVEEIDSLYRKLGAQVFKQQFFRRGLLRAKFSSAALEAELERQFSDISLGSKQVKTGLAIVLKRLDTGSPWVVYNAPTGKYFSKRPGKKGVANKEFLLRDLIRASAAAPTYFEPEALAIAERVSGAFVDGGVSPHNNPALQTFLLATLSGYGLQWSSGADQLLLVSVGTGTSEVELNTHEVMSQSAATLGVRSLVTLMNDTSSLNEMILQSISDSPTARQIDRVVGEMRSDQLAGKPLLSYLRYDARLDSKWLREHLSMQYSQNQIDALESLSNANNIQELAAIGRSCGDNLVKASHFSRSFDVSSSRLTETVAV